MVRIFAFNNGRNGISSRPIQDPVGVFHEDALQHYDYVLAAAGAIGIRLLLCLTNHWCAKCFPRIRVGSMLFSQVQRDF